MTKTRSAPADHFKARMAGLIVLDANDPEVEQRIGEHIFKGRAFALDYRKVPVLQREALQDLHVLHLRAMQDLARERFAGRLN